MRNQFKGSLEKRCFGLHIPCTMIKCGGGSCQIGEPVYRYELERLLDESPIARKRKNMERLLAEKKRIEEEIKELKKEMR